MARIRTVKPEFWVSEQVAECSSSARLTFIGLWNFCDDQGVHPAKPKTLKAELYPMDDITASEVETWVGELLRAGLLAEFTASEDGERYWQVTGWNKHQKIDRPSCKHPAPPPPDSTSSRRAMLVESSTSPRGTLVEGHPPEWKGKEGSGEKKRAKSRADPAQVSTEVLQAAGFDAKTAADFLAHKTQVKAPLTERAWADHCREAQKAGWTPQQAAEKVMAKGWKGFEAKYVAAETERPRGSADSANVLKEMFRRGAT